MNTEFKDVYFYYKFYGIRGQKVDSDKKNISWLISIFFVCAKNNVFSKLIAYNYAKRSKMT